MDYKSAGVDIDAGNEAIRRIKPLADRTLKPHVLSSIGGFAGCFEIPKGYQQPVLVSCTDGVGTKLKLAIQMNRVSTIGIDLVAMNVNDLICCGAKPLVFLDYFACHQLDPAQAEIVISGIAQGCLESGCSLIGGEMSEMRDMYQPKDFDLAGFCVGVVEKSEMITGKDIQPGDRIYAIPSSGIHSNGYSLVRKIFEKYPNDHFFNPGALLAPTRIYVKEVQNLLENYTITGLAHITGGGLVENCERICPKGVRLNMDCSQVRTHQIFEKIKALGGVSDDEMWRVFNMGVGMVVISHDPLPEGDDLYQIGVVEADAD